MTTEKFDQGIGTSAVGFLQTIYVFSNSSPFNHQVGSHGPQLLPHLLRIPGPPPLMPSYILFKEGELPLRHSGTAAELRSQGLKRRLSRPPP